MFYALISHLQQHFHFCLVGDLIKKMTAGDSAVMLMMML